MHAPLALLVYFPQMLTRTREERKRRKFRTSGRAVGMYYYNCTNWDHKWRLNLVSLDSYARERTPCVNCQSHFISSYFCAASSSSLTRIARGGFLVKEGDPDLTAVLRFRSTFPPVDAKIALAFEHPSVKQESPGLLPTPPRDASEHEKPTFVVIIIIKNIKKFRMKKNENFSPRSPNSIHPTL